MNNNIFIPKKIKVGFQKREDTYTGKLGYVIYYDHKGILRKESSWSNWKDDNIDSIEFDNIPIDGFVLNKKVGDYSTGWNHRQAYCRIYDKRNFEFEITIENLLYILENANSIKGKGLEGEFIYGWDRDKLLLMPISSPDYKEITQYNEIVHTNNFIKAKDLILGATYISKNNEQWIYMGRFDYWDKKYEYEIDKYGYKNYQSTKTINVNKGKYYYFVQDKISWYSKITSLTLKSLGEKFIGIASSECVENYADLFDRLEQTPDYSPYDKDKDEYIPYTFEEFCNKVKNSSWDCSFYNSYKKVIEIYKNNNDQDKCYFEERINNNNDWYHNFPSIKKIEGTYKEIFNQIQPMYKNEYLQNGKFYRREY